MIRQGIYNCDVKALYDSTIKAGMQNVSFQRLNDSDHVFKFEGIEREKLGPITTIAYNASNRVLDPEVVTAISTGCKKLGCEFSHPPNVR